MLSNPCFLAQRADRKAIPLFRPHVQDVLIPAKNGIRCADPAVPRLATGRRPIAVTSEKRMKDGDEKLERWFWNYAGAFKGIRLTNHMGGRPPRNFDSRLGASHPSNRREFTDPVDRQVG
jgi:hypothetical protein